MPLAVEFAKVQIIFLAYWVLGYGAGWQDGGEPAHSKTASDGPDLAWANPNSTSGCWKQMARCTRMHTHRCSSFLCCEPLATLKYGWSCIHVIYLMHLLAQTPDWHLVAKSYDTLECFQQCTYSTIYCIKLESGLAGRSMVPHVFIPARV